MPPSSIVAPKDFVYYLVFPRPSMLALLHPLMLCEFWDGIKLSTATFKREVEGSELKLFVSINDCTLKIVSDLNFALFL